MKRCRLLIKLALVLCLALAVVSELPSTLAYIATRSNTMQNAFRVVYLPPQDVSVPVNISKSLISLYGETLAPGGFEFELVDLDSGETLTAVSADDGSAAIELRFTADDLGKTRRYRLSEVDTGRECVIYDDSVYEIGVTLALNEIHEMSAELTMDGERVTEFIAQFVNQYEVTPCLPATGDSSRPLLWFAMLIASGMGLNALDKRRTACRRMP